MSKLAPSIDPLELGVLPGEDSRHRVLVVLAGNQLQLCSQSWGDGIGWYTQSTVTLETDQAAKLRHLLGAGKAVAQAGGRRRPRPAATSHLRLHRAESA